VKCPRCQHEFALSWAHYFRLTLRKFACPRCSQRLACHFNKQLPAAVFLVCFTLSALLGIIVANRWLALRRPWFLVGASPAVILILPASKLMSQKWGTLRAIGESAPAQVARCAECQAEFPIPQMITHNGFYYCAACKPVFLQKIAESALPPVRPRDRSLYLLWWVWACILFVAVAA
jgi:hypothetical protein